MFDSEEHDAEAAGLLNFVVSNSTWANGELNANLREPFGFTAEDGGNLLFRRRFIKWSKLRRSFWLAGELGFEPRQTELEFVVLPLHHSPMIAQRHQYAYSELSGSRRRRDDASRRFAALAPFYPLPAGLGKRASLRSSSRSRRLNLHEACIPRRNRATRIALVMRGRAQRNHLFACGRFARVR